ncbi:alpha/beta hydrolase [Nonomuraea sp. K274]|uniref:Alpha/beta hydrolase n=1 Tax=Nonomuraea cypriaca TaxID=1187855 RepID=A0A931A6A5_9ACTN|nr:alpha/beta hydrolase [Nonomuraea cypriaca]MBF8185499.1 alpha/beta hydrolase [Nonomuraea cypriaca]
MCYEGLYVTAGAFGTRRTAEKFLARRACPALSLHSLPKAATWESAIPAPPGSRVVTWPGTGHFLHLERPAAFAALLTQWLMESLHDGAGTLPSAERERS